MNERRIFFKVRLFYGYGFSQSARESLLQSKVRNPKSAIGRVTSIRRQKNRNLVGPDKQG
jgi:hypothetical protein